MTLLFLKFGLGLMALAALHLTETDCDGCGRETDLEDITINDDGTETCPDCTPPEEEEEAS